MGSKNTSRFNRRNTVALCTAALTLLLVQGCACNQTACNSSSDQQPVQQPVQAASGPITEIPVPTAAPMLAAPTGHPMTTQAALADFDAAWTLVNDTHFDENFNGVDWDAMRDKYRPMAEASTTRQQTRRVIGQLLDTLGQSHFNIIPADLNDPVGVPHMDTSEQATDSSEAIAAAEKEQADAALDGQGDADVGLKVLILDGHAVVSEVRPDSPADHAGVRMGWIVSHIRSESIDKRIERLIKAVGEDLVGIYGVGQVERRLRGPKDSTIDLEFLDSNDQPRQLTLSRDDIPGEQIKFGNLPPMLTNLEWGWIDSKRYNLGDKKIGYIDFTIWMMPIAVKFEEAMVGLKDADGIIIDLRGNPGGVGGLAAGLARYFLDEKQSLGTMQMRGQKLTFNVSPIIVTRQGERLKPYTNPVAIITDQGSASTSEFFAGGLQALGRVEVFGTRSAGMALAAAMDKLPSDDVLIHAISDYTTSAGNAIEATGVIPEHPVKATRADLLNGIDAPMQSAADWIKYKD
ncbi:MAG: hypothetical protein JKY96_07000 [Phycisphaerales bacterium]|nr:hypothetical protein [Phycisphaerales bacterium]